GLSARLLRLVGLISCYAGISFPGFWGDRPRARRNLPSLCLVQQMRLRGISFVRVPRAQVLREPFQQHSRARSSALVMTRGPALSLANARVHLRVPGTNSVADPCG